VGKVAGEVMSQRMRLLKSREPVEALFPVTFIVEHLFFGCQGKSAGFSIHDFYVTICYTIPNISLRLTNHVFFDTIVN